MFGYWPVFDRIKKSEEKVNNAHSLYTTYTLYKHGLGSWRTFKEFTGYSRILRHLLQVPLHLF